MTNSVAPVEGHYALLRNGSVVHPECITEDFDLDGTPYYLPANSDEDYYWTPQGVCQRQAYPKGIPKLIFVPDHDIIATIAPADMQAVASGELEQLRAEKADLTTAIDTALDWAGAKLADLIAACEEALNWADANARAFPIKTVPYERWVQAWNADVSSWQPFYLRADTDLQVPARCLTHWRPLPPPPSNPPLPAPLERLGEVLRRVKGVS